MVRNCLADPDRKPYMDHLDLEKDIGPSWKEALARFICSLAVA
jgi:hypothetical protein